MKGKEGSGDPEGPEAKSGLASSGRGLDTSVEKGFFGDVLAMVFAADAVASSSQAGFNLLMPSTICWNSASGQWQLCEI